MAMQEAGGVPEFPTVPQTQPAELVVPPTPTSWPTVIGVIAIVLGALGALGGLWGAISPWFTDLIAARLPEAQRETLEITQKWRGWTISVSLVSLALAILLLVAGIGLVKRRSRARQTCTTWAVLRMPFVVVSTGVGYRIAQETLEVTARHSTSAPGMAPLTAQHFAELGTMFGLALGLLWGLALPVFLLIWFARRKVRDEVAGWA